MNRRKTGAKYEERAARWLLERGFQILERNFRCRQGEIDLIARDGDYLVFIEVKYRRDGRSGYPAEAVDRYKQEKLIHAALRYCSKNRIPETQPCRFDVIGIHGETIEYISNAFECI